ncbi:unnamed protein product, partial [marine sediment metagenome]
LVIDEIKLWGREANEQVANLIKSRYKKGLKVSRVNLLKEGEDQVEYFDVFGPLVICTTEPLPDIIESRCLTFLMKENIEPDVEKTIDEEHAQKLRNLLTIFRLNQLDKGFEEKEKVARRRLNEILIPLHRCLMLVAPDKEKEFKTTIKEIEKIRKEEAGLSLEAEIIEAITEYQKDEKRSFILTAEIQNRLNEGREAIRDQITAWKVASLMKKLGFIKRRERGSQKRGYDIKSELLKDLQVKFDLEKKVLNPEDQVEPEFNLNNENMTE